MTKHQQDLLYTVKGICMDIHSKVGCGLMEHAYHKILKEKLQRNGHTVQSEVSISITYEDIVIENAYRADLIVDNKLIIELKAIEKLETVHFMQLGSYMQLSGFQLGLLVNFHERNILDGMYTMRLPDLIKKYGKQNNGSNSNNDLIKF